MQNAFSTGTRKYCTGMTCSLYVDVISWSLLMPWHSFKNDNHSEITVEKQKWFFIARLRQEHVLNPAPKPWHSCSLNYKRLSSWLKMWTSEFLRSAQHTFPALGCCHIAHGRGRRRRWDNCAHIIGWAQSIVIILLEQARKDRGKEREAYYQTAA